MHDIKAFQTDEDWCTYNLHSLWPIFYLYIKVHNDVSTGLCVCAYLCKCMCFPCFYFVSFFVCCVSFVVLFYAVLFLPICLLKREEKRRKKIEQVRRQKELRRGFGRVNHDQNILYEKNYFQLKTEPTQISQLIMYYDNFIKRSTTIKDLFGRL